MAVYPLLTAVCTVLRGGLHVAAHSHGVFMAEIECGSCHVYRENNGQKNKDKDKDKNKDKNKDETDR